MLQARELHLTGTAAPKGGGRELGFYWEHSKIAVPDPKPHTGEEWKEV